jgi:S1-C subfamily serine protease
MRENESEPGDRREPPGYGSPWTHAQPGDDPGYPPPHYANDYGANDYGASDYGPRPHDYGPSDYGPSDYGPDRFPPPPGGAFPPPPGMPPGSPPPGFPPGSPPPGFPSAPPPGFPSAPPREDTLAFGNPPGLDYGEPPLYGPPPPPRPSRGGRLLVYFLVAAVAAALGAGVTVAFNHSVASPAAGVSAHDIPAQHDNAQGSGNLALNAGRVERKVEPGLVDITATLKYQSETAEGTGMVLSSDGLVLTNNHVIDGSTNVLASLVDSGRQYPAKVIGYDATADIALLQLEGASGLPTVSLGNSSQLNVGTAVLALGNAQGKGGVTPAPGVINGLDRSINASDAGSDTVENLHGMEQTSAQIQQGDSGGALADNAGQVIGMITAANTSSPMPGGTIGFAIPINSAISVARQIANDDATSTVYIGDPGFLGVMVATSNSSSPRQEAKDEQKYAHLAQGGPACIQNNTQTTVPDDIAPASSGVLIIDVLCGTAGSDIGLQAGDVVTSVNGHAVGVPTTLGTYLNGYHPGDTVTLDWTDTRGEQHSASVTLGPGPVH